MLPLLRSRTAIIAARASSTLARSKLPPHKLMPMPRLSPTMTTGTLLRWHIEEGAEHGIAEEGAAVQHRREPPAVVQVRQVRAEQGVDLVPQLIPVPLKAVEKVSYTHLIAFQVPDTAYILPKSVLYTLHVRYLVSPAFYTVQRLRAWAPPGTRGP